MDSALQKQIQKGMKLKKAQTNDRSAPVLTQPKGTVVFYIRFYESLPEIHFHTHERWWRWRWRNWWRWRRDVRRSTSRRTRRASSSASEWPYTAQTWNARPSRTPRSAYRATRASSQARPSAFTTTSTTFSPRPRTCSPTTWSSNRTYATNNTQ